MPVRYSAFQKFGQHTGSSPLGVWIASHVFRPLDRLCIWITRGRMTATSFFTGLPVVLVSTVGAKSGLRRTLPLTPIADDRDPSRFALIGTAFGSRHHPAWYYNLQANPHVTCSVSGRTAEYTAHQASGEEYDRFWKRAIEIYPGYQCYRQSAGGRHIPILVLEPIQKQVFR